MPRVVREHEKNELILRRIMQLIERGEKVDRVTLSRELMAAGELEKVGGICYLVRLGATNENQFSALIQALSNDARLGKIFNGDLAKQPAETVVLNLALRLVDALDQVELQGAAR